MKPAPKTILGILVIPARVTKGTREEHPFILKIGMYGADDRKEGILLISSPEIRRIIQEKGFRPGHLVGNVTTTVDHQFKRILTGTYAPISFEPTFQRKGVGDFLDLLLEKKFAKEYPNYVTHGSSEINGLRRGQLRKRKREPAIPTTLSESWKLARTKVIANHRKNTRRPGSR